MAAPTPEYAASGVGPERPRRTATSFDGLRSVSRDVAADRLLEVELASLDQAEQGMESLKSRIEYLERRASSSIGATERELEDLMSARDELAASAANIVQISRWLDRNRQEESEAGDEWDGWNDY